MKTLFPRVSNRVLKLTNAGLFACLALLANRINAANQWWDNNGTAAPTSGTWDTTSANWTTMASSNLTASTVVFTNGNFPEFAAGTAAISALTITVPGPVTCAGLSDGLNAATVTNLTFSGPGPITLASGAQGVFCGPSSSDGITFNTPIAGTGQLVQHSSGSLSLKGTNTYSGGTALTGGQVIYYYNNYSFGSGPISVGGNGNALLNNTVPEVALTITNAFTFPTAGYALNLAGGLAVGGAPGTIFSGAFGLPATGTINFETSSTSNELDEISGVISGASGLTVSDAGILALAGTNTYSGGTTVSSPATLVITNAGSLGSGNYAGAITNNWRLVFASSVLQTNSGVISGTGTLTENGGSVLTLSGANTYTNATTLLAGEIDLASASALGSGPLTISGGTLASINAVRVLTNKVTVAGSFALGGSPNSSPQSTIFVGAINLNNQTNTITLGNNATFGGAVTNGSLCVNAGANTLTLTNTANTYSGPTIITGTSGGLTIATAGRLGSGTYAGVITNNGTFTYGSTAAQTLSGAIFGTGTFVQSGSGALTLSGFMYGTGTVIENGPGTLTLSAESPSFTGTLTVNAGELISTVGSAASTITVAGGATYSVFAGNNSTTLYCNSLTYSAGTAVQDFNFGNSVVPSTTQAPITVSGAVTFTGTPTVTIEAGAIPSGAGTYPLMTWGSVSGTPPTTVSLPPHVTGSLVVSGNTLELVVTGNTQPLYWTGAAGNGLWDINTSTNWVDSTGTPTAYLQTAAPGDAVVLDESYITAPTAITLNTVVSPASVTVSNNDYAYSISGTGGIAGGASLLKLGASSLTLFSTNTYTGQTLALGGTLTIGGDASLGAAPGSSTANSLVLSNSILNISNTFTLSANRGITMLSNTVFNVLSGSQMTFNGNIAGPADLVQTGPGTLVVGGGLSTFTGNVVVDAGILQTGGDQHSGGLAANLGITPSVYEPTNITLAGGMLQGNNSNFSLNTNRGIILLANSSISSLSGSMTGISAPIIGNYGLTIPNHGVGVVYLTASNTYTGDTLITGGTLALQTNGSINSSSLNIAAGTTFDVAKLGVSSYVMGGSSFTASGLGTTTNLAATITTYTNGSVSMGSLPVYLRYIPATFTGDATNPALYVVNGALVLNGNAFTVTNAAATPLGVGSYVLIQQRTGTLTNFGSFPVTVAGTGLVADGVATIAVSGLTVSLVVTQQGPMIANTVTNIVTYGSTWQIAITNLAAQAGWSDLYNTNTLTVTSAGPLSVNGTNITTDGTNIYYDGVLTSTDSFSYTISDGTLSTNGTVYLVPTTPLVGNSTIGTPTVNGSGNPTFSGQGVAGYTYGVESTTNLLNVVWIEAGNATADTNGNWSFTDTNQVSPSAIFYRLYYPDNPSSPPQ